MRIETVAAQIASRTLTAVSSVGLQSAYYPPPSGQVPTLPTLLLALAVGDITHGSDQLWLSQIRGWLLARLVNDTSRDVGVIDPLITPIVDTWAAGSDNATLDGRVDYCLVTHWEIPEAALSLGGVDYYGARLIWTVKSKRFPGDA